VEHSTDYLGTALLAAGLSAIVLLTTLGGTTYAWDSAEIVLLGVAGVLLLCGFVFAERQAAEPVLPLRLFRNSVFSVTSAIGFVIGFALFGAITYLPLFLQIVNSASPTGSGLELLPLMAGLLITSIGSGQLITRTGRYRPFPIAGTAVMVVGLYLLSLMDRSTSTATASCRCSSSPSRTRSPTRIWASRPRVRRCSDRSAARSAPRSSARSSPTS
jgi:predicted MFS family arabinose efflux permease